MKLAILRSDRDTFHSGTKTFPMLFGVALSSSWLFAVASACKRTPPGDGSLSQIA
jgi:hypothetical protein